MSEAKKIQWLEAYTGIELGTPPKGGKHAETIKKSRESIDAEVQNFEAKRLAKAEALAKVRLKLVPLKADSQKILSTKITAGPLKGKSFLKVEGEQVDEIDPDTLRMLTGKGKLTISDVLPGDIGGEIALLITKVERLGAELSDATFDNDGKQEPLFTAAEVQAEFWTPVKLERIYPDGLMQDKFSETQQMLDATNDLYLQMVEQKKLAGELTPEMDLASELLGAGKDLTSFAGEVVGAFAGDVEGLKLAKDVLSNIGTVLNVSEQIYQQVKDSDFGSAASSVIDLAGTLTGAVLRGAGVDAKVADAATAGFKAGSSAVLLGKALHGYATGTGTLDDALGAMGNMLAKSLALGAANTSDKATVDALAMAGKMAPAAFKTAGLASGPLVKAIRAGDFPAVVATLGTITKEVLNSLPGLDKIKLDTVIDLAAAGVGVAYKVAINARRGDLTSALNAVVDDIGTNLGSVLELAGVDSKIIEQVTSIYDGSASASKVIQQLAANPSDPLSAMAELTGGIEKALGACGDPAFSKLGAGLKAAVEKLVAAKEISDRVAEGKYDEAVGLLITGLSKGVDDIMNVAVPSEDEDGEESTAEQEEGTGEQGGSGEGSPQKRKLKGKERTSAAKSLSELAAEMKTGGVKADPQKIQQQQEALKAELEKAEVEQANEEAMALLEQTALDLNSLSEAQKSGAEASSIDNIVADLLRDRMIQKIAMQIAEGGTAFLAKFVPGLGAASAGIKLAAQLIAVSQRARQLDAWIKARNDLKAAQSPISTAAENFVKSQGQQLAHYSAQAAFAAAQLAGEITKMAGPAAPIGAAISAIAGASATAETVLMERKDKVDIEKAWKVTLKALRNPKNRQLGLEARRLNPSLAKFSIAWGAVVLKDPLARNAMRACNLTEASLNNDSTDTDKVVQYLETFYVDDKTLYRDPVVPPPVWVPADPEVSLIWWSQLRSAADTKGGLSLSNTGQLEGLLGQLLTTQDLVDTSADAITEAQSRFRMARSELESMLKGATKGTALLPPPIDEIESTMETHSVNLTRLAGLYSQIASAYTSCVPAQKVPGRVPPDEDPGIKNVMALLEGLKKDAETAANAARQESTGLDTSLLEFKGEIEALRRKAEKVATPGTTSKSPETVDA